MKEFYKDHFEEIEDDKLFGEDDMSDFDDEANYPTAEEYNRIHKQKYDYF